VVIDWENLPELIWAQIRVGYGYALGWWLDQLNASVNDEALRSLRIDPADAIVEVGFGGGGLIRRIAKAAHAGFVAGVDPSPLMYEIALRRNQPAVRRGQVDLRLCDPTLLPWPEHRFDKAVVVNGFTPWSDPAAIVRTIGRVLRPGGTLLLISHKNPLAGLYRQLDPAARNGDFPSTLLGALPQYGFRVQTTGGGSSGGRMIIATHGYA
jgi:ubiquinone/menaquinone biosynthesis C-methylase UbiE